MRRGTDHFTPIQPYRALIHVRVEQLNGLHLRYSRLQSRPLGQTGPPRKSQTSVPHRSLHIQSSAVYIDLPLTADSLPRGMAIARFEIFGGEKQRILGPRPSDFVDARSQGLR
jgi:hypothetical protein